MSGKSTGSPGESRAGGTFRGGTSWLSSTSPSSPSLPLPTHRSSGPAEPGTMLVSQGWAYSSPHGTEKGWSLPSPVLCQGAAGAGLTPLPTAHGCGQDAGSCSTRGIALCCHPETRSTGTRALKPGAGLPGRGCPTRGTPQQPCIPPKTEHTGWGLPWQRREHPIHGSTRVPVCFPSTANACLDASLPAQPTRRPSLLPVQCCHVLPPRLKPPPMAQWRRMTQSSSGADIGGLASEGPSTGALLPTAPPCPGRHRSAQLPRGLSHSLPVGRPPQGRAAPGCCFAASGVLSPGSAVPLRGHRPWGHGRGGGWGAGGGSPGAAAEAVLAAACAQTFK